MRALIYKRTHTGDLTPDGRFAPSECMGNAQAFPYNVIIGVGGFSDIPVNQNLAGKINWIGRNPTLTENPFDPRGPLVSFKPEDFRLFEDNGPLLISLSPILDKRVYGEPTGHVFDSLTLEELREVTQIVHLILDLKRFDHQQVSVRSRTPGQGDNRVLKQKDGGSSVRGWELLGCGGL